MDNKCKCGKTIPENSKKCDACKRKTREPFVKVVKGLLMVAIVGVPVLIKKIKSKSPNIT